MKEKLKPAYYKCLLSYISPETKEKCRGWIYASFEDGTPDRVWAYFKLANTGAKTWAILEITESEFTAASLRDMTSRGEAIVTVSVDKYFTIKGD